MKQMSTGFGLAVLGACVLGAAFIASPRFGQQAFAQVTGERRIVSAGIQQSYGYTLGYRIWSDNTIEMRNLGYVYGNSITDGSIQTPLSGNLLNWKIVDNGLATFVPADVDANGTVDSADIGGVLLDMGNTQNGNPPPPIDCTINAPR